MDFTALGFYALVCGALSFAAPRLGPALSRFAIGALVGVLAALFLPSLKTFLGL